MLTGIDTLLENNKTATNCQIKDVPTLFQLFLKKSWTKSCLKVELNSSRLVTAAGPLGWENLGIVLAFISRVDLFDYAVDGGGDLVRDWLRGMPNRGYGRQMVE